MSNMSNNYGRAYEYAILIQLKENIEKYRNVEIVQNSSLKVLVNAWNTISQEEKESMKTSAKVVSKEILSLEPYILDSDDDVVELASQKDTVGEEGDVRDILIIRNEKKWEIGLSVKHNHFAIKHSRLAKNLDFGEKWFGIKCSTEYWKEIEDIFKFLDMKKREGKTWRDLKNKGTFLFLKPLLMRLLGVQELIKISLEKWLNIY